MAISRNKRKKKYWNVREGRKKEEQNRIKLFKEILDIYLNKSYPVLVRFAKQVNSGNRKLSFIRIKALEMAIKLKVEQAIKDASKTLEDKVSVPHIEDNNNSDV